ncbi:hypothetical protein GCM10025876_15460 [Demequina litorisediminis]|uniref:Uncharacterized protein n=1 Tax=Demequina litorisediminis TaxID=1849022 RepID=A0ABQ6IDU9_9MICO|nr:hypothetical protein GCM10025876_15460 [Demequina litorisediminis]
MPAARANTSRAPTWYATSAARLVGRDVHGAAAEAGKVAVGHLSADHHTTFGGKIAHATHGRRVTRVKAAGHVGARDHVEQTGIVRRSQRPKPSPRSAFRSICHPMAPT